MHTIYQVTIHGRTLESRDLRRLLARAVSEKRIMDRRLQLFSYSPTREPRDFLRNADLRPSLSAGSF